MGTRIARVLLGIAFLALIGLLLMPILQEYHRYSSQSSPEAYFTVVPNLREFYLSLGGEEVLGGGISDSIQDGGKLCQYTEGALLCYDPIAAEIDRFNLFPLGKHFVNQPDGASALPTNGYEVYSEFAPLYQHMGGAHYVGLAVTPYRMNEAEKRIEQIFENVGYYRSYTDPPGQVHLLALGAYYCKNECKSRPAARSIVRSSPQIPISAQLYNDLNRIGLAAIGKPLTEESTAADGNLEQVFEGLVVYATTAEPNRIRLRPLPELVDIPPAPPGPQLYQGDERMTFYRVEGDLGYNVPVVFDQFIAQHGGREISGPPTSEVILLNSGLYRQCFKNYCLDYDPSATEGLNIRLASLGALYKQTYYPNANQEVKSTSSNSQFLMYLSEKNPRIPATEMQEIDLTILRSQDRQPVERMDVTLEIVLPDSSVATTAFPPTDSDGHTRVTLPALTFVSNGTVIPYRACLTLPSGKVCISESFLIWNYR
jgi:hypothetical protein